MNTKFEVGDTVQLKSGGAIMTVADVNEKYISCVWLPVDAQRRSFRESFSPEWLNKVEIDKVKDKDRKSGRYIIR